MPLDPQLLVHLQSSSRRYLRASAQTALVAGCLSLANAATTVWLIAHSTNRVASIKVFVLSWITVLLATGATALFCLSRTRHSRELLTEGTSETLRTVLPPVAVAAGASVLFFWDGAAYSMSIVWITCYGLALRSLRHFAPPLIKTLGTAFLTVGVGTMVMLHVRFITLAGYSRSDVDTALTMAATFGFLHLIYALAAWLKYRRSL